MLPKFPIGRKDAEPGPIRRFTDAAGLEWTVYAVVNPTPDNGLAPEFLCFERGVDRRRLVPVPADWRGCSEAQLRAYLGRAKAMHRSFASPDQFRQRNR